MKREFLQLAHSYKDENVAAWYASEKLDGVRCFWDGGITTGMLAEEVPWANTAKHGRYVNVVYATGLWTRYGQPIQAPESFLRGLPPFPLDGELWIERGAFQEVISIIKQLIPDKRWDRVQYMIIDAPSYREVFCNGEINSKGKYVKMLSGAVEWCCSRSKEQAFYFEGKQFFRTLDLLKKELKGFTPILMEQEQLPFNGKVAFERLEQKLSEVMELGGEGLVLRSPASLWVPGRVHSCLKYKPTHDSEGIVMSYTWGAGKLLGLMGSLEVLWQGKTLHLSGFTDKERILKSLKGLCSFDVGSGRIGEDVGSEWYNPQFKYGDKITFTYRELSDDGIPKEARYLRKRED